MQEIDPGIWDASWLWALPLIAVTVVIHVFGLGVIDENVERIAALMRHRRRFTPIFALIMGVTVTLATLLHGLEATVWAASYRMLGALPDRRLAMLYSLNAMTSYGHTSIALERHWQLMGALEALNGWLLFGLTTAFLFAMIQRIWPVRRAPRARRQTEDVR
jgi:hypothetical protein